MNILLKNVIIVNKKSSFHLQKKDISILNGKITAIENNITIKHDVTVAEENLHVSMGWIDVHCNTKNPGFEYKETLQTLSNAASAGGYTHIAAMPTSMPITQNKTDVLFTKNATQHLATTFLPIGAITKDREGKEIAELFDMEQAGAVAFSDGKRNINDAGLLQRVLYYTKTLKAPIISFCDDKNISLSAHVNEGILATKLGLKGVPALAEELIVQRNIAIAEYSNAPIHITCISTKKSLSIIKEAKAKGINVTCDVASHYLLQDESVIEDFDTNTKVYPPYRTVEDKQALIIGLVDGTIDCICSDHTPENIETKQVEFELASYGIINLETSYSILNTVLNGKISETDIIEKFTTNAAALLNLDESIIEVNNEVSLTLYNPNKVYTFSLNDVKSKSSNTPFINTKFKGKVYATFNKGKLYVV